MTLENGFSQKSHYYKSTSQATRHKRYKFCYDRNEWSWKLLQVIQRMHSTIVHPMSEEMIYLKLL
jgi:hypothetical protein